MWGTVEKGPEAFDDVDGWRGRGGSHAESYIASVADCLRHDIVL